MGRMAPLQPHHVSAFNLAKNSENKMHDDTVARRFGFEGGLVPGVDVFAYMSHMPAAKWGKAFFERGTMSGRFLKPVYDGEMAVVTAMESADGGLDVSVESRGVVCASGYASMNASAPRVSLDDFKAIEPVASRSPVDGTSYRKGEWLGIPPFTQDDTAAAEYLRDIRETEALFARHQIMHPGMLLRTLNWALMENAILGPWIHVGNTIHYIQPATVGDVITVRAKVVDNYEHKGHMFVELDGLIVANGDAPVAHCQYTAIYKPREQMAA
jgi:acyl dehydratase